MPKSRRDLLKRQMAHAYRNIGYAMGHLANVQQPFAEQHPHLAEALEVCIVALHDLQGLLDHFASEAWGRDSINWDAVANVPELTDIQHQNQLDPNYVIHPGRPSVDDDIDE